MNEPTTLMLRQRDVRKWIPTLNAKELYKLEAAGVIHTFRRGAKSHRWYYTAEILDLVRGKRKVES